MFAIVEGTTVYKPSQEAVWKPGQHNAVRNWDDADDNVQNAKKPAEA